MYLKEGTLTCDILKGYWADCGTYESLLRANMLVAKKQGVNLRGLV
jgi:glucose-1-phosphate thymidylyltransferase